MFLAYSTSWRGGGGRGGGGGGWGISFISYCLLCKLVLYFCCFVTTAFRLLRVPLSSTIKEFGEQDCSG